MWIVRIALERPYTFLVLGLAILILSPVVISRTPTDIFPNVDIPVVAVAWQYTGLNPEELEGRLTTSYERGLTTLVDNIEHIESTTINGQALVKLFLQPKASLDTANAQITAFSQTALRSLPPGTLPPLVINYSASSVPILQLGLSGNGLSEAQLNDLGLNFLRTQLITVPGAVIPFPYGGKVRQIMIDLNPSLLQSKGLSPPDVLNALQNQNLVLPSGTAKIGLFEYDVRLNASVRTVPELNDLPIKVVGRLDDLSAGRRERPRWLLAANEYCSPGRSPGHPRHGAQSGQRLDDRCGKGHPQSAPARRGHPPARAQDPTASGSVHFRSCSRERSDSRGHPRRLPDRPHDPDLSWQLA